MDQPRRGRSRTDRCSDLSPVSFRWKLRGREDAVRATTCLGSPGSRFPPRASGRFELWRRDAAGNSSEASASSPVTFRYDPEAPKVAFDPVALGDPTLVTAPVSDPLSGVASGQVEISREGSGSWQSLPTKLVGDRLQTRIDDSAMPAGRYLLRASADDHAGNRGVGDKRTDGSAAVVTLPLRLEARLSGGFRSRKVVRRVIRRAHRRRVVKHHSHTTRPTLRLRRGRLATIVGRLRMPDKQPLPGAAVYVFEQRDGADEKFLRRCVDQQSRYLPLQGASGGQRRVSPGLPRGALDPARDARGHPLSPGGDNTSSEPTPPGQRAGTSVPGLLASPPSGVAAGKLVELQTRLSGRWQTFRTVRTDAKGHWAASYRFRRTRGLVRYSFRVRLPAEAGYPFATGATHRIGVTVRGR